MPKKKSTAYEQLIEETFTSPAQQELAKTERRGIREGWIEQTGFQMALLR